MLGGYILRTGYILWQVNLSGYILCHWLHFVVGKSDAKCNRLHFVAGYILRPYSLVHFKNNNNITVPV